MLSTSFSANVTSPAVSVAGTYYVNAVAELGIAAHDQGNCALFVDGTLSDVVNTNYPDAGGNTIIEVPLVGALDLSVGDTVSLDCDDDNGGGETWIHGTITAVLVNNSQS